MPDNNEPEDINDELPEEGGEQTSPIDQRQLADEAAKRRKELPLLQRIVKHFSKDRAVYRELVINAETLEKRVALLTNGVLDKFEIEHKGENRMVGAIFKGRVQNLEGGLKAAFVDIGPLGATPQAAGRIELRLDLGGGLMLAGALATLLVDAGHRQPRGRELATGKG